MITTETSENATIVPVEGHHVRRFAAFMLSRYGVKQVDKSDSAFMRAAGAFLDVFGFVDRDEFLDHFTTTIGRRMWTPFTIGEPGEDGRWSLWSQIETITHECQHVVQDVIGDREGTVIDRNAFKIAYATSAKFRTQAEIEAYGANIVLRYWRTGAFPDAGLLASLLSTYGVGRERITTAEQIYRAHIQAVKGGRIIGAAARDAIAFLQTNMPELQHPRVPSFNVV